MIPVQTTHPKPRTRFSTRLGRPAPVIPANRTGRLPAACALLTIAALALTGCSPAGGPTPPSETVTPDAVASLPAPSTTANTIFPVPHATTTPATYGPDQTRFPADVNPLSGLPVDDPALLKIPAVLVSISHFPATARPQAGLSFAPFVYEFSITGGETRFLAAFYGQFPVPERPVSGDCGIRRGAFVQTGTLVGGRAWLDTNADGIREMDEGGVPGVCVRLYDGEGNYRESTTTDTNGFYGFNVASGQSYIVRILKPAYLDFTRADIGNDNTDSDIEPSTGQTKPVQVTADVVHWDAGLIPNAAYAAPTPDPKTDPKPEVGPVRSGRLLYSYIGGYYQDSCLIYAFASPEVLSKLPHCSFVAHNESGGGEMLSIDRLEAVAQDNMRHTTSRPFDYASNLFSELPPSGGAPASQINVFFGNLNQSGWTYDPLYQAYLRYVDTADPKTRGVLHPDVDRLTGRQLHFENLIVVMADTDVITSTNLDIHLDEGNGGPAVLFRDGQAISIKWSTRAGDYEKHTGLRRPIQFLNADGSPAPLKPGHTWVIIVTPFSTVQAQVSGVYMVRYAAPAGEAQ